MISHLKKQDGGADAGRPLRRILSYNPKSPSDEKAALFLDFQ